MTSANPGSPRADESAAWNRCYGCGEDNPIGLRLGPLARIEGEEIHIECTIDATFDGFDGIVHGGVVATILDEAMGMANSRIHQVQGAVTARLEIEYLRPVRSDSPIKVRARSSRSGRKLDGAGEILDQDDEVLAKATSLWVLPVE